MSGRIEVITGPMFSGKTEELTRRLRRAEFARYQSVAFKPVKDNRYSPHLIQSHSGQVIPCFSADNCQTILDISEQFDYIGIDEGQFFGFHLIDTCVQLREEGKTVIVTGLDTTFRGEPWPHFPLLMALSDKIDKLTAVCVVCGRDAVMTQRIVNGRPASFSEATIVVGGTESYEARCRDCFKEG